jgi:hypothetical protein
MTVATIVAASILLFWPNVAGLASPVPRAVQSGQTQQDPQDSSQPSSTGQKEENQPKTAPAAASKPCSEAQSKSTVQSDCKATPAKPKSKKQAAHKTAKSADTAASKTVVRNGGTGESTVSISSDEGKQAARIKETNRLLAAADLNLKDVAVRGLNASQEVTIKQIRSYMDQAKAAANSGDVERAYNLANKANMLAADLNAR